MVHQLAHNPPEPGACTIEEAIRYRKRLRNVGPEAFVQETIEAGVITAKKLLTAFGIKPPLCYEDQDDEVYYPLVGLALSRELQRRAKLSHINTVDDAVKLINDAKNIIVLTGAGISTSLGIPDFRSKGTGLYSKLAHLGLDDPQDVFEINLFRDEPKIFYTVAKDILPTTTKFTPTHAFIKLLQDKGKLLTNYSQNIDNIESVAGIQRSRLIQCHGSFATATCIKCQHSVPGESIFGDIRNDIIPKCAVCTQRLAVAPMKRKRSSNGQDTKRRRNDPDSDEDGTYDIPEPGVMKPDITFFGEQLPNDFSDRLALDKSRVDLVIVIGTSLKVAPVSDVVPYLAQIPQLYISREPVTHVEFDVDLLGDCDVVVSELCRRLGWDLVHEMIPNDQVVDVQKIEGYESRHAFRIVSKTDT